MRTLTPTQYYVYKDYPSSGYSYDKIVVRENGIYGLTANLGIFFNNDNFDGRAIASIAIYRPSTNQYLYMGNLSVSSGANFQVEPILPTLNTQVVLEQGEYEIYYGVRRSGSYTANLSILLEKLQ